MKRLAFRILRVVVDVSVWAFESMPLAYTPEPRIRDRALLSAALVLLWPAKLANRIMRRIVNA